MEKRRSHVEYSPEAFEKCKRSSVGDSTASSNAQDHLEQEKRVRREIANSNERRRMQSINAGFDSLRILLPTMQDGEKMSKATILQLTAEYINNLLRKVTLLEHEVAAYRQSAGLQPTTVLPDFSLNLPPPRKRRLEDQRKRFNGARSRRRRVEPETPDTNRQDFPHCSPNSLDTRQTSPSNSFVGSISVSPTSPPPESASSTSARLEHLVMAIEQIEGGRALHGSGEDEIQDESFSTGDQSPPVPSEACWQSPQENYHGCVYSDGNTSLKPINPFPEMLMLTPVPDVTPPCPVAETDSQTMTSTDYPVTSKLLNRPIPHKYLHRPQVVVNSSH